MRADLAQQRVLVPGRTVTVEVPATSANVGPGFDCFGLALDWRERVKLAVIGDGYRIEVSGEGAAELPRDESHLIIRAVLVGLADLGVQAPGLWLDCRNTIPHARGLGSSSAAIVAGLWAAAGLAETTARPEWLLRHATAIEGHPDNVAAAIYGGFVLAYEGRAGVTVAQGNVHPSIAAALFIPETSVGTESARGLLPEMVPHAGGRRNRDRDQRGRPPYRCLPLVRSGRSGCQHHRLGGADHPSAQWHRGFLPERAFAVAESRAGDADAPGSVDGSG